MGHIGNKDQMQVRYKYWQYIIFAQSHRSNLSTTLLQPLLKDVNTNTFDTFDPVFLTSNEYFYAIMTSTNCLWAIQRVPLTVHLVEDFLTLPYLFVVSDITPVFMFRSLSSCVLWTCFSFRRLCFRLNIECQFLWTVHTCIQMTTCMF